MSKGGLAILALVILACLATAWLAGRADDRQVASDDANDFLTPVSDVTTHEVVETFRFSSEADMQLPELPTGCEATALGTTLRLNDIPATKAEVADAMPKGDGSDFVNRFWGDPCTPYGWACMAPCVVDTAKVFLPSDKTVLDLSGTPLSSLPAPCVVWVTIGIEEGVPSGYEQSGYRLLENPHCVTLLAVGEDTVTCYDPLEGLEEYPFSKFENAYAANGRQAVYIADRGYAPLE
ncbi:C39 family peptidase [Adlercreutzia sp. ZJ242]|uniref:C39 family peptidase n=1 Tax=Adlercreutzia sp. ZJ242 TaxID=2709409 RepID=UPI0019819011|nr:C39 family peptidase [Adlercreutzia sp. ZJ242]